MTNPMRPKEVPLGGAPKEEPLGGALPDRSFIPSCQRVQLNRFPV
jgi:hypothetical protein